MESGIQQAVNKAWQLSLRITIEVVTSNLESQRSVHTAALRIPRENHRLDILRNTAGLMVLEMETTEEGIEIQI